MRTRFLTIRSLVAAVATVSAMAISALMTVNSVEAVNCPELGVNTLFKVSNYPAVYIVNKDHRRMYFPNAEVYNTWYNNFSNITTIDPSCVDNYPSGGGVNYRPGSRLVKTVLSPSVYVVGPNNTKHRINSEGTAVVLFSENWSSKVRILSDAFDSNLKVGADVQDIKLVDGMLVNIESDPQAYFVSGGQLKKITTTLPSFLSQDIRTVRQTMLESTPISTETVTAADIVSDPTQGGVGMGIGQNNVPATPNQSTVPPVTQINPQTMETGGNYVDVVSCKQVGKDIQIKRLATDSITTLTSSCRDAGNGLHEYTVSCGSNTRYYVSWKPCTSVPVQTPVQTSNQTDLLLKLSVTENNTEIGYANYVSYGSGFGYPWNPDDASISQNVEKLNLVLTPKVNGGLTYGFIWVDNGSTKVDFTDARTREMAKITTFSSSPTLTLPLTDNYRGKWILLYAFARNNDGVAGIPGMPVEVDDVIVTRFFVPAKVTTPVVTGPNLSLAPKIATPSEGQILSNYPRTAEISFNTLVGAKHYEVEVQCDYCGHEKWQTTPDAYLTYTVTQPSSGYAKVITNPLYGDNEFRVRTRAVYLDTVTAEYKYGSWSEYRYFSYDTMAVRREIDLTGMNVLGAKTIDFEDATGEIITKYVPNYGVTIWSNNGKAIYANEYNRGGVKTTSGTYTLFNNATSPNTSANSPLYLGFNTIAKAVGFYLIPPSTTYNQELKATITVWGISGKLYGTFYRTITPGTNQFFAYYGPEGITKIDIDYGTSVIGEQIDNLMIAQ